MTNESKVEKNRNSVVVCKKHFCFLIEREEFYFNWKAFEIQGEISTSDKPQLLIDGYVHSAEWTDDPLKASVFAHGCTKWDGCSNFYFPDECYHSCDREYSLKYFMDELYDLAAELL